MITTDRGRTRLRLALLTVLLVVALASTGVGAVPDSVGGPPVEQASGSDARSIDEPRIVELYPNPIAHGNVGEFVAIEFPEETELEGWTLRDDDRQRAELPKMTVEGTVVFSGDPNVTREHTDHDVYRFDGHLQFAENGDTVTLHRDGNTVDSVTYDRAPEAELWERGDDTGGSWSPIEATDFEPTRNRGGEATGFVLPDSPDVPIDLLDDADQRVMLAAYTYSDGRVTDALIEAHDRGVDVRVAVEASPVGGTTNQSAEQLDELTAAGVDVVAFGGDGARYRFHHGKFAVVDDEALVTTENWKPSGIGGRGNRGWGVVTHDGASADAIAGVFEADWQASDARSWDEYRETVDTVDESHADGRYPSDVRPERLPVDGVTVLTAPDNAEATIRDEIRSAEESIRVTQVSIGGREDPLLQAALDAARRGVDLRILLSSAWYTEADNAALRNWIETTAAAEDLDVDVRLAEPDGRYEKLHTKGVIVDSDTVIVGSVNWNRHSLRENRELALILDGDEIGGYFAAVFDGDLEGPVRHLPVGLGVVLAAATIGTTTAARRSIVFE